MQNNITKKRKYVNSFNDFRSINITNNIKNIINKLRYNGNKNNMIKTYQNHGAYKKDQDVKL